MVEIIRTYLEYLLPTTQSTRRRTEIMTTKLRTIITAIAQSGIRRTSSSSSSSTLPSCMNIYTYVGFEVCVQMSQKDRQMDKHTHTHTHTQTKTERQTDTQKDRKIDRQTNKLTSRHKSQLLQRTQTVKQYCTVWSI